MSRRVEILERETPYQGYFRLDRYRLRHSLFSGGLGPEIQRECFERGHSAGVLPYDPDRDEVVLVEQFRIGALEDERGPWLIELIAGIVEPGETPADVVRREAREEADCVIGELLPIADYQVSPGGTSERHAVFCASASTAGLGGVHGHPEEDEDILVHVLPADEALDMVENGAIHSAMAIVALQWLALNRERLIDLWSE